MLRRFFLAAAASVAASLSSSTAVRASAKRHPLAGSYVEITLHRVTKHEGEKRDESHFCFASLEGDKQAITYFLHAYYDIIWPGWRDHPISNGVAFDEKVIQKNGKLRFHTGEKISEEAYHHGIRQLFSAHVWIRMRVASTKSNPTRGPLALSGTWADKC